MTQQLSRELTPSHTKLPVPDLWVLSVVRSNTLHDVPEILHYLGVARERTVVVTDANSSPLCDAADHLISLPDARDAAMWNAGLDHVRRQHHPAAHWDVLLLDPALPLSKRAVNSLRHHMRMTDVWMAEPDVFGTLLDRSYLPTFQVDATEAHPSTVVVVGENAVRLDAKYYDASDAWVEYCRRTRALGGSVRVSSHSLKERVS